ncbi:MAG: hypothetical protein ABR985_08625 [Methanotrichaceae archaeon]|jgi:phage/plasmid-associated DNA primase
MTTPDELSGILNLIIARSPDIIKTQRIIRRGSEDMAHEYTTQSNSVKVFLDEFCDYTPHDAVGVKATPIVYNDVLYAKYCGWCELLNADMVNEIRFGNALKNLCGGHQPKRTIPELDVATGEKKRHRYHVGLSFDQTVYDSSMGTNTCAEYDRPNTDLRPIETLSVPSMTNLTVDSWNMLKREMKLRYVISVETNNPKNGQLGTDSDSKKTTGTDSDQSRSQFDAVGIDSDFSDITERHGKKITDLI